MERKINWGILSTAYIAVEQVIPAMKKSKYCNLLGIASRDEKKAVEKSIMFDIPKSYGSYKDLLEDDEIEAVYIPLPNHLHVPWAIKALQKGKHVLVEKPIGLNTIESRNLMKESQKYPSLKVMEAFMYKFHPQWIKIKELVQSGFIGELKSIQSSFSFFDDNPASIVNKKEYGGGSLMDIGCYPISLSRYLFNSEPRSVSAKIEYHKELGVDLLTSSVMEFDSGHSSFFCSTILEENQKVEIFGTNGIITVPVPFNPDKNKPSKLVIRRQNTKSEIEFEICDQYEIQVDHFSVNILNDEIPQISLQDSINNLHIIEKIFESDEAGKSVLI